MSILFSPIGDGKPKESAIVDTCWTISAIATASSCSYTCSETSRKLFSFSRMSTRYASRKVRGTQHLLFLSKGKGMVMLSPLDLKSTYEAQGYAVARFLF